jgi:hypothetical protein
MSRVGDSMIKTEYRCQNPKCKAVDYLKSFPGEESAPDMVNCWSCHAGFKMDPAQMMMEGVGMKQVYPAPQVAH